MKYNYEFSSPDKMVIVGDRLATDVMFGNLNNMATIKVSPIYKS